MSITCIRTRPSAEDCGYGSRPVYSTVMSLCERLRIAATLGLVVLQQAARADASKPHRRVWRPRTLAPFVRRYTKTTASWRCRTLAADEGSRWSKSSHRSCEGDSNVAGGTTRHPRGRPLATNASTQPTLPEPTGCNLARKTPWATLVLRTPCARRQTYPQQVEWVR